MRYLLTLGILIVAGAASQTSAATFGKCKFNTETMAFAGTPRRTGILSAAQR